MSPRRLCVDVTMALCRFPDDMKPREIVRQNVSDPAYLLSHLQHPKATAVRLRQPIKTSKNGIFYYLKLEYTFPVVPLPQSIRDEIDRNTEHWLWSAETAYVVTRFKIHKDCL